MIIIGLPYTTKYRTERGAAQHTKSIYLTPNHEPQSSFSPNCSIRRFYANTRKELKRIIQEAFPDEEVRLTKPTRAQPQPRRAQPQPRRAQPQPRRAQPQRQRVLPLLREAAERAKKERMAAQVKATCRELMTILDEASDNMRENDYKRLSEGMMAIHNNM